MRIKFILISAMLVLGFSSVQAQTSPEEETKSVYKRHFIGSTMFMIMTPILDPSPEYYQLNYGFRLTPKDVISIEAITWTYTGPLGRQYGNGYEDKTSDYPGSVTSIGAGLAYKRFLWKGLYAQVHSTAFRQHYYDEADNKIQSGFQLFNSYRVGYHLNLFNKRWFIEPSVACTNWPINTNLPDSFQVEEDKWDTFFLFEPGLQFGFNF